MTISAMVFTGLFIAFAVLIMIGLYDTDWFLNFNFFGTNIRDLFQIRTINLSVAVWVGFLALFGIATDDGVLVATFLQDSFKRNKPNSIAGIRDAVVEGGLRRSSSCDDDHGDHYSGITTCFDFYRKRVGYYAAHGNSFLWWDDFTNGNHVYRTRFIFPLAGMGIAD